MRLREPVLIVLCAVLVARPVGDQSRDYGIATEPTRTLRLASRCMDVVQSSLGGGRSARRVYIAGGALLLDDFVGILNVGRPSLQVFVLRDGLFRFQSGESDVGPMDFRHALPFAFSSDSFLVGSLNGMTLVDRMGRNARSVQLSGISPPSSFVVPVGTLESGTYVAKDSQLRPEGKDSIPMRYSRIRAFDRLGRQIWTSEEFEDP